MVPTAESPDNPIGDTFRLTPREMEVAELRVTGLMLKEIAAKLNISPHTVRNHLDSIRDRLGARNTIELCIKFKARQSAGNLKKHGD